MKKEWNRLILKKPTFVNAKEMTLVKTDGREKHVNAVEKILKKISVIGKKWKLNLIQVKQ